MLSMINKEPKLNNSVVNSANNNKPTYAKELFTPAYKPFDLPKELRIFDNYIRNNKINLPTTIVLNDSIITDTLKPIITDDLHDNEIINSNELEMIETSLQTSSYTKDTLEYSDDDDDDDDVSHNSLLKGTSDAESINQYILDIVQKDVQGDNHNSTMKTNDKVVSIYIYIIF